MSNYWGPSAEQRYVVACHECSAATDHLARQHKIRELMADERRPVLDPQYEAALDRLEAAERELRLAYEQRNQSGRHLQHIG